MLPRNDQLLLLNTKAKRKGKSTLGYQETNVAMNLKTWQIDSEIFQEFLRRR